MLRTIVRRLGRSWRAMRNGPPNASHYIGGDVLLTRTRFNSLIYLDARDVSLTPSIALTGEWEPNIEREFRRCIRSGDTIVDIGANCGYYALAAAGQTGPSGRVVAIEPNPRLAALLRKSVAANNFRDYVSVHEGAVLDHEADIQLGFPADYFGSASIFISQSGWEEKVTMVDTRARPLRAYLSDSQRVDVMKIDTEGAEPLIWRGAEDVISANRDITIFMEFAPSMVAATMPPADFLTQIRAAGFNVLEVSYDGGLHARTDEQVLAQGWSELVLTRLERPRGRRG